MQANPNHDVRQQRVVESYWKGSRWRNASKADVIMGVTFNGDIVPVSTAGRAENPGTWR
jgi:hypothetical protein